MVGWHLSQHMPTESVFPPALAWARIEKVLASYCWPGNPGDNAQIKAAGSTLKTELLPHGSTFANLEEGRL